MGNRHNNKNVQNASYIISERSMLYHAGLVVNRGNLKSRQLVSVFNCYLKTSHMQA